ncbi:hypothetical protein Tco_0975979 [Tanacetum coccineum]|uniref:Uncharacterized protein n=1 Tax=Tanacetum coccineum TaxID=301880 RepID=A0ABQ5EGD0_9ASTR
MNQNQIGRTVFDIDEETDAFYLQKASEYHEWLLQQEAQPRLTRTPIFRDREDAERRLRADYFDDHFEGLSSLQIAFRVLQEWGGDPCLPAPYSWEWIVCSNDPAPRGLEVWMTDDAIMDKVLGTSRGFNPRRGRKLPNSSSSSFVRSYPTPPPSASQAALARLVEAHN